MKPPDKVIALLSYDKYMEFSIVDVESNQN